MLRNQDLVVSKGKSAFNRGQHYLEKLSRSTLLRQNGSCGINRKRPFYFKYSLVRPKKRSQAGRTKPMVEQTNSWAKYPLW